MKPPKGFGSLLEAFSFGMTWRKIVLMTGAMVCMLSGPVASEEWMDIKNPKELRGMKSRHAEERGGCPKE